jgi:hypothetical protein
MRLYEPAKGFFSFPIKKFNELTQKKKNTNHRTGWTARETAPETSKKEEAGLYLAWQARKKQNLLPKEEKENLGQTGCSLILSERGRILAAQDKLG